jgi:hypothetical protein
MEIGVSFTRQYPVKIPKGLNVGRKTIRSSFEMPSRPGRHCGGV